MDRRVKLLVKVLQTHLVLQTVSSCGGQKMSCSSFLNSPHSVHNQPHGTKAEFSLL